MSGRGPLKIISKYPWWWDGFLKNLQEGKIYAKGDKGDRGEQGPQGRCGNKGDRGEKGDKGEVGNPLSIPPQGMKKVTNLYVNNAGKLVVEYDETPAL